MATPEDSYTNIPVNAIAPVDLRKMSQAFGAAEYVGFEVLVSYLARTVFKIERRSIMELAAIHAVSIPFMGGLAQFSEENTFIDSPVADAVADGAKGVPAVFAAQYVCNTALSGLHAPSVLPRQPHRLRGQL